MRHNIALYIRVSTEEQALRQDGSIENQKHRLLSFVDLKNMQESGWGKIVDNYTDEGLSAKDTKRPAFQRMMRDVRNGKINLILVADLARLSRNILDFCILLEDLKKANAKFLSLKEQFDTTTAAGEMMVFNMINLAQFERKQTSERVSMNFHARALRGLRNGGSVLLGFNKDPQHAGCLVLNENEAQDVRLIFQTFIEEGSLNRACSKLSQLGIKPKTLRAKSFRHNANGRWTIQSLQTLLRNPSYVGLREVNRANKSKSKDHLRSFEEYKLVKASWPPIVEMQVFESVQQILDDNLVMTRARLSTSEERVFILSGRMHCGECGRPLMGVSGHGVKSVHRYYVHRPIQGEKITCAVKSIRADEVEAKVLEHLDTVIVREGYLDGIEDRIAAQARPLKNDYETERRRCEDDLAQIERDVQATIRASAVLDSHAGSSLLRDTLKNLQEKKTQLEARMLEVEDRLENIPTPQKVRKAIEYNLAEYREAKRAARKIMLKRLLSLVVEDIVVEASSLNIRYWETVRADRDGLPRKIKRTSDDESSEVLEFSPQRSLPKRKVNSLQFIAIGCGRRI